MSVKLTIGDDFDRMEYKVTIHIPHEDLPHHLRKKHPEIPWLHKLKQELLVGEPALDAAKFAVKLLEAEKAYRGLPGWELEDKDE